jgi:hypothetical protein
MGGGGRLDVMREWNGYWPTVGRVLADVMYGGIGSGPIWQIPSAMKIVYSEHVLQDLSEIVS